MDIESCNFRISSSLYLKSARAKRKITCRKARETVTEDTLWLQIGGWALKVSLGLARGSVLGALPLDGHLNW